MYEFKQMWGGEEYINCSHQTLFWAFIIPHQEMSPSSAVTGDRRVLIKLPWTNLFHSLCASLKPNIHLLSSIQQLTCLLLSARAITSLKTHLCYCDQQHNEQSSKWTGGHCSVLSSVSITTMLISLIILLFTCSRNKRSCSFTRCLQIQRYSA